MSKEKTVPGISPCADWRDPESYKSLVDLDRAGWAWEWLKRNPGFSEAADRASRCPPTSAPAAAEHPAGVARPRIVRIDDPRPLEDWGVLF